jgi:hypothetical protein
MRVFLTIVLILGLILLLIIGVLRLLLEVSADTFHPTPMIPDDERAPSENGLRSEDPSIRSSLFASAKASQQIAQSPASAPNSATGTALRPTDHPDRRQFLSPFDT